MALTVVPVMGTMLLRAEGDAVDAPGGDSALQRVYTPLLRWTLRHKIISIAGSVLLVAGGVFLLPRIPIIFLPSTPPSTIQIDMELPPGTGAGRTFAELIRVEQVLDGFIREGAVAAYQVALGAPRITSGPGTNATGFEFATFTVSLPAEFPEDLEERIRTALPRSDDVEFTVTAVTSASVPSRMELTVSGPRFSDVAAVARQLEAGVREIDGLINVSSDVSVGKDETIIRPDLKDAAEYGLTAQDVGAADRLLCKRAKGHCRQL